SPGADGTRRPGDLRRHRAAARDGHLRRCGGGRRAARCDDSVRDAAGRRLPAPAASDGVVNRLDATRVVVDSAGDAPIVASLGHPAYDLFAAGDRPQNFYTWGSMGVASSIGLGLALAKPHARVFVIDGDGSLLMNLGSLATIGLQQPANLVLVVMDNEEYATTGGQATPTAQGADLAAAARAMRVDATTVFDEEQLRRTLNGARLAQRP